MAVPIVATPAPGALPPPPTAVARTVNPSTIVSLPAAPALVRSHSALIIAGVAFTTLILVMIILRLVT
jgi:hypothetical protein